MCESRCWQRNSRFYKLSSSLEHDLDHRSVRTLANIANRIFSATGSRGIKCAQELPLFARSARASVKPRHIKRLSIRVALRAHRLWVAVTGASLCH